MKKPLAIQITEALSHFSRREKLVLYAAVAVVALLVVDRLILRTATARLSGLNERIAAQESQIQKDLRIVAMKKAIEEQRAQFSSYLVRAKSESEEVTALQKEIRDYADQIKFSVFDMKSPAELPKGKGESSVRTKTYTVTVSCEGTMEQIMEFMFAVETAKRLLTIDKYSLIPKSKDSNQVKASLTIRCLFVL